MSRYSYQGREPSQHLAVGWDPVRGSFFGQLWAHPEQEEDIPLFVVGDEEIITDLTFLDAQLAPYGLFPHPYNQPCCRTGNSIAIDRGLRNWSSFKASSSRSPKRHHHATTF